METKIGYKVVNKNIINGNLESATLKSLADVNIYKQFNTIYKVGEFVEPKEKGTVLFVFDTLTAAVNFSYLVGISSTRIYKCEYVEKKFKRIPLMAQFYDVAKFWKDKKLKKSTRNYNYNYRRFGTKCATQVKLLEKV